MAAVLIPGLPDGLVYAHVLPCLPWRTSLIARSLSKLWKTTIKVNNLFKGNVLAVLTTTESHEDEEAVVAIEDPGSISGWQKLPCIPRNALFHKGRFHIVAWNDKIYLWRTASSKCWYGDQDKLFKLDIGTGNIFWEVIDSDGVGRWWDSIQFQGNIFLEWASRRKRYGIGSIRLDVKVYNMETDQLLKTNEKWPCEQVAVVDSTNIYGFVWSNGDVWQFMEFDTSVKVWKTIWSFQFPLIHRFPKFIVVSGECSIPAHKGFNILATCSDLQYANHLFLYDHVQKLWIPLEGDMNDKLDMRYHQGYLYATNTEDQIWRCKIKGNTLECYSLPSLAGPGPIRNFYVMT